MLPRYRRLFFPVIVLLLALPLVGLLFRAPGHEVSKDEARVLAPAPSWPATGAAWLRLPAAVNAYMADHFGFRRILVRAQADLVRGLLAPNSNFVLVGKNFHLFYRGQKMIEQSAGLILRREAVDRTADMLATLNAVLKARGISLLVASPPNASTEYPEDLPDWARNPGRPTEYDLLMSALERRAVHALDLRPPLRAAKDQGRLYFWHDTHWSQRGSLVAFNAISAASGHSDWRFDPAQILMPAIRRGGDLARLIGLSDELTEPVFVAALPPPRYRDFNGQLFAREIVSTGPAGGPEPTIMIIGDSFTDALAAYLTRRANRVYFVHHLDCGFNLAWIDRLRPSEVWYLPTERFMLCPRDYYPRGLSQAAGVRANREAVRGGTEAVAR